MKSHYSLKAKISFFTFLPMFILCVVVLILFFFTRPDQLKKQMRQQAKQIVGSLSVALEHAIAVDSQEMVRQIISQVHKNNSETVRTIAVFDKNNNIYASSVFHADLQSLAYPYSATNDHPLYPKFELKNALLIVRMPIIPINNEQHNPLDIHQQGNGQTGSFAYVSVELDTNQIMLRFYQESFCVCFVIFISLALTAYFSFVLIRQIINPINSMVDAVDHIRRGHLDVRITKTFSGELTVLKNGINEMASTLSDYHMEMHSSIEQATSDLRETLEQLEIQNIELDLAKKEAQEAARIKSEFLTNISHELRTPLNGVLGFTKQLLKTPLSYSQKDYMLTIEQAALNLLHIVNDVLDFSKLDAKKLELDRTPFYLRDLINESIQLLSQNAYQKEIDLIVNVDESVIDYCIGDPLRIGQVLTNLISNAIKFTERGAVHLRVSLQTDPKIKALVTNRPEQQTLTFSIKDSGIGIPIEQQKRLFQAFQQADSSISRQYGGTGLGLVISKQLVDQMHGHIGFESILNEGATFYFTLPLIVTPEPQTTVSYFNNKNVVLVDGHASQLENSRQILQLSGAIVDCYPSIDMITDHYDCLFLNLSYQQTESTSQLNRIYKKCQGIATETIIGLPSNQLPLTELLNRIGFNHYITLPLSRQRINSLFKVEPQNKERYLMHVLAVDDNKANLKLICALLDEVVLYIASASSGKKALEFANEQQFDLIFMDIQMPELDGIQTRKALEKSLFNAHTPVIAVTANALSGTRERLLGEGFSDYLTKPIDEVALLDKVQMWGPKALIEGAVPRQLSVAKQNRSEELVNKDEFDHFDPQLALKQAAGKSDLAQDLLNLLLTQCKEISTIIEQSLNKDHVIGIRPVISSSDLAKHIHKLHGGCSYCGVMKMQKLCQEIEQGLASQKIEDLEPELLELLDEMQHVQNIAGSFLFQK